MQLVKRSKVFNFVLLLIFSQVISIFIGSIYGAVISVPYSPTAVLIHGTIVILLFSRFSKIFDKMIDLHKSVPVATECVKAKHLFSSKKSLRVLVVAIVALIALCSYLTYWHNRPMGTYINESMRYLEYESENAVDTLMVEMIPSMPANYIYYITNSTHKMMEDSYNQDLQKMYGDTIPESYKDIHESVLEKFSEYKNYKDTIQPNELVILFTSMCWIIIALLSILLLDNCCYLTSKNTLWTKEH